jgi:hypothetical protein
VDEQSPHFQATVFGWLGALLIGAWGWIAKNVLMRRLDDVDVRVDELERTKANRADCQRQADLNEAVHGSLHRELAEGRDRTDRAVAELRGAIDTTRRELKDDLRTITDLLRQRQ